MVLDSDYDEDDEDMQGELDDMFSSSMQRSEDQFDKDDLDSDDDEAEQRFDSEIKFTEERLRQVQQRQQKERLERLQREAQANEKNSP